VAEIPRAKAPERLNSLKILYWRFRDSANLSKNSVPDFQPRGRGSYYEALRLRCQLLLQDSQSSLHLLATITLPADLIVIAEAKGRCNPWRKISVAKPLLDRQWPHKYWGLVCKKNLAGRAIFARRGSHNSPVPHNSHSLSTSPTPFPLIAYASNLKDDHPLRGLPVTPGKSGLSRRDPR
jgi:hypothetical protein